MRGQGLAEVKATGANSEIGRIGKALGAIETASPRLTRQTNRIVRVAAGLGGGVLSYRDRPLWVMRGTWLNALLAGLALGMAMLPEEFPLVLTVFMVMGAWRMSRARVLTRRASAIETLGEATVLCTDKTGTLTENRMSIIALHTGDKTLSGVNGDQARTRLQPAAFLRVRWPALRKHTIPWTGPSGNWQRRWSIDVGGSFVRLYGLQPDLLAVTYVWDAGDSRFRVATKGAPEAIADLCHLDSAARDALRNESDRMAEAGMRVLAVAEGAAERPLPETPRGFPLCAARACGNS